MYPMIKKTLFVLIHQYFCALFDGNEENGRIWLNTPNAQLNYNSPADMINKGKFVELFEFIYTI
jgi:uncharacterized protein (DUF2384 family)